MKIQFELTDDEVEEFLYLAKQLDDAGAIDSFMMFGKDTAVNLLIGMMIKEYIKKGITDEYEKKFNKRGLD